MFGSSQTSALECVIVADRRLPDEEFNRLNREALEWASRMTLPERGLLNQLMQLDENSQGQCDWLC